MLPVPIGAGVMAPNADDPTLTNPGHDAGRPEYLILAPPPTVVLSPKSGVIVLTNGE